MTENQTPTYTALELVEEILAFLLERIPRVPPDDSYRDVFLPRQLALSEALAGVKGGDA